MEEKIITEKDLEEYGFTPVKNDSYHNGTQWLLQVSDHYLDTDAGEIINREGTWFDAIGRRSFKKNGAMTVSTLCRGNYVCDNKSTIEELELLYLALTGEKLKRK